jgi:effector-binding domain-containing protein
MLTLPRIIERPAQPYVGIRRRVRIPFGEVVGPIMSELFGAINTKGIQPVGPVLFKYNIVAMPDLEIDFGVPVAAPVGAEGRLVGGTVPAGRYAELTYWGHYDNLIDVNAVLIGWARQRGIVLDAIDAPNGEHFAGRVELYHNGPDEEPDPDKWKTTLIIKIKD